MPNLPTVGGDAGVWGDELNNFLSVELDPATGVLKRFPPAPTNGHGLLWDDASGTWVDAAVLTDADIGVPNGVASLDPSGRVPLNQFPGEEVAYAEYQVDSTPVNATPYALIPGLTIVVPAGTGPYWLEAYSNTQITATAANGAAIVGFAIVDELGKGVAGTQFRAQIPVSGQLAAGLLLARRRMPSTGVTKTFQAQMGGVFANATAVLKASDGTGVPGIQGPSYIAARLA